MLSGRQSRRLVKVTEILIGYVKALMEKASQAAAGQAERYKDRPRVATNGPHESRAAGRGCKSDVHKGASVDG